MAQRLRKAIISHNFGVQVGVVKAFAQRLPQCNPTDLPSLLLRAIEYVQKPCSEFQGPCIFGLRLVFE